MSFLQPDVPKGPSADELARRQKAARDAEIERSRLAEEKRKSDADAKASAELSDREAGRRRLVGRLSEGAGDTDDTRRRFLKGA